jgi:ParB-like chromosome segregation protein Spo0J
MPAHDLTVTRSPVVDLRTYYRNPRRGDVDAIAQSLTVNGQYRPIVGNVGTHTKRPNEVLAGNHTLMAARDLGWPDILVAWVDVDEDQAARIVAADNRTSDLADYDSDVLVELLGTLDGLEGTGFTDGDLARLLSAQVGDRAPEEFAEYDEGLATEYQCPKCSYEWSGKPK